MSDAPQITIELGTLYGEGSVADMVAEAAARRLLESERELSSQVRSRIIAIRDEEIRDQVKPLVAKALDAAVQLTDEYGAARGPAKPLREIILDKAAAQFKVKQGYRKESALEEFIREEIERAFRAELQSAMKEARAQVLAAVREQGAAVVQETIERMARV